MDRLLTETVQRLPPLAESGTTVAVDTTGLSPGTISTYFVKRARDHGNGLPWRF